MTLNLTLYTFKTSLCGAAPRLAINELNVSNVKQIEIDITNARNFSPSYLNINRRHTVSALEKDEDSSKKCLNDTISVIYYLNEIAGSKLSIPEKKAEIDEFIREMHEEADIGSILFFS